MKILNNYVLVMPDYDDYQNVELAGTKLTLNTSYEKQKHAPTSGIVIGVPDRLFYSTNEIDKDKLLFDTDMELLPGDRIIFNYKEVPTALSGRKIIDQGIFIRYDKIYAALRGDKIIMINGYIMVEAMAKPNDSGLALADSSKAAKPATKHGIIKAVGSIVRRYRFAIEAGSDNPGELQVGQEILFHDMYAVPFQYQMHSIIDNKTTLYRMQQKDVVAILDKEEAA